MARITKDMVIGDIIKTDPGVIKYLMNAGMHCAGCPSAQHETLEEAVAVHGADLDSLVDEINAYLEAN
jgi:hybrid cluster-associated redox disulfide protein